MSEYCRITLVHHHNNVSLLFPRVVCFPYPHRCQNRHSIRNIVPSSVEELGARRNKLCFRRPSGSIAHSRLIVRHCLNWSELWLFLRHGLDSWSRFSSMQLALYCLDFEVAVQVAGAVFWIPDGLGSASRSQGKALSAPSPDGLVQRCKPQSQASRLSPCTTNNPHSTEDQSYPFRPIGPFTKGS